MGYGTLPFGSIPGGSFPTGTLPGAGVLLVHTPAEIMAQLMIDRGSITCPTTSAANDVWPVYIHQMPDGNGVGHNILAVFNTSGVLHGKDMYGTQYQHHAVQVRLRHSNHKTGYVKLQNIVEDLLRQHRVKVEPDVGGEIYYVQGVTQSTGIVPITIDDKNRTHLVVNFLISITRYL